MLKEFNLKIESANNGFQALQKVKEKSENKCC